MGMFRRPSPFAVTLGGILLLGAGLRLWLLARGVPTLDSDEAVIGLMALHDLRGEWSVFFWGQVYMGSLEAVLTAPLLWLFGPSALALRLAPMVVGLGAIASIATLGARLYGRWVGLATALLLALGAPFFVVMSLRAYGGYPETLLFGSLLLLLALDGERLEGRTRGRTALMAVLAGLALWTDPLVLPFVLAVGALWWWQRRTDLLRRGMALTVVGGVLLGAAPLVLYNLRWGGVTFFSVLSKTAAGTGSAPLTPLALLGNLWLTLTVSAPTLAGVFYSGGHPAGFFPADFAVESARHPLLYVCALLLALAVVVALGAAGARVGREWRRLRKLAPASGMPTPGGASDQRMTRLRGEAALLLVGALSLAAFALNREAYIFTTPRYLLPLYALTPVVVAQGGRVVTWLARRWPGRADTPRVVTWLAAVPLAALLAWNVAGCAALTPQLTAARGSRGTWISGTDQPLLAALRARQIRTVISNDYWEGLRLTYESGEHVVVAMFGPDGRPGFNRYPPYEALVRADPRPAYLNQTGTPDAQADLARLAAGQLPGYSAQTIGIFTLLLPPPS